MDTYFAFQGYQAVWWRSRADSSQVEQYLMSSCLVYLKRTLAHCIITMCTVRLQYEQPWIIFWKSLTHPEPSMLSGLYRFSARREFLFPHLQIKQSGYSYLLHLLKSAFVKYSLPFLVNVWNLAFAGKTVVSDSTGSPMCPGTSLSSLAPAAGGFS